MVEILTKRKRILLWSICLMTICSLSSCIKDGDRVKETILVLKSVTGNNFMSTEFEDPAGLRYVPSQMILTPQSSDLAYVHFKYDETDLYGDTKSININVLSEPYYISEEVLDYYTPEIEENPQHTLIGCEAKLWGTEYIVLAPSFYISKYTSNDKIMEEVQKIHHFAMYYNPNEQLNNNTLQLQLRYEIHDKDMSNEELAAKYSREFDDARYFPISYILDDYKAKNGNYPSRIEIAYYKANSTSEVGETWGPEIITLDPMQNYYN